MDRDWRAESDARALKDAEEVLGDPARYERAKVKLAEEAERARRVLRRAGQVEEAMEMKGYRKL